MMAKEIEEEVYEVPDAGEEATTTLGSLLANIKLAGKDGWNEK